MTERPDDVDLMDEFVERGLDMDVAMDELWRMISEGEELATWLADEVDIEIAPGGRGRIVDDDVTYDVEVEEVTIGERVVWWWTPIDPPDDAGASRVELTISPTPDGGRLTIVESRPAAPVASLSAAGPISRWEVRSALAWLRSSRCVMA
jgi:uncharacterized protein YndB with AHSA1/START domain